MLGLQHFRIRIVCSAINSLNNECYFFRIIKIYLVDNDDELNEW